MPFSLAFSNVNLSSPITEKNNNLFAGSGQPKSLSHPFGLVPEIKNSLSPLSNDFNAMMLLV